MGIDFGNGSKRTRVLVQGCDRLNRSISMKRLAVPHAKRDQNHHDTQSNLISGKQQNILPPSSNILEMLPQEILVHLLCKASRSSLNNLILVSKGVHEAAMIAKESHFDVSTPMPKRCFDADVDEAPGAPQRAGRSGRLPSKLLESLAVALFTGAEKQEAD